MTARPAFCWSTMRSRYNAPSDLSYALAAMTSTSPAPELLRSKTVVEAPTRISWCSTWGFSDTSKAPKSVAACGRPPPCRSSCSRPEGRADQVNALDLGADDYVAEPAGARGAARAYSRCAAPSQIRRRDGVRPLRAGDLTIDYDRRRVLRNDTEMRLTPKEFELVSLLARNHDRVLTHRAILKEIWGANAVEQPEHLWTLIAQLGENLETGPGEPPVSPQRAVGWVSVLHGGPAALALTPSAPIPATITTDGGESSGFALLCPSPAQSSRPPDVSR